MQRNNIIFSFLGLMLLTGCSAGRILVIKSAGPVFDDMMTSIMQESDVELAKPAMASNLKILEGLIESSPKDRHLLSLATQGFAGYAMLFYDPVEPDKAADLYRRAMNYGLQVLQKRNHVFGEKNSTYRDFTRAINSLEADDVGIVYWTAVAWAGMINLSKTDPNAVAGFPRVQMLMEWVSSKEPKFFYSGPKWFQGVYYASLPPILGGDPQRAGEYFRDALKDTNGDFLLGKVLYARTYAVQTMDRDLFQITLTEVLEASSSALPEVRLLNEIAKLQARQLLLEIDEIF